MSDEDTVKQVAATLKGQKCSSYNCTETGDLIWGPDPYNSEINGDDTPVWLCSDCYATSCDDI